ncbi:PIG-L family deacetylase [Kitasatospora sp. NPDC091276]|uniref:PIG-L deacetylase family protein n=1 Tax=Kitasatospora sp. NPDC091276 TaxID=3155300 RepID=UPI00343E6F4C
MFDSPHQDDEAIGLAGSILEHKASGRPVYLVLVTRGENGGLAPYMNQGTCQSLGNNCSAPGHYHALGWAETWPTPEVVVGRTAEFKLSAKALGVAKVINFDLSDEANGDFDGFVQKVIAKVRSLAKQYPGASHKFAAGRLDGNPTHKACSDAASSYVLDIPDAHMAKKRASILASNTWDPKRNLYALGYRSVPVWMEQSHSDPREFVHTLPSDYKPGPVA